MVCKPKKINKNSFIKLIYNKKLPFGSFLILNIFKIGWGGRIRTSEMPGPKPGALPLGDAPSGKYYNNT